MNFSAGQGILGKIKFRDGEMPVYDRTYLVVAVGADYLEVVNVSSIKGKESYCFQAMSHLKSTNRHLWFLHLSNWIH